MADLTEDLARVVEGPTRMARLNLKAAEKVWKGAFLEKDALGVAKNAAQSSGVFGGMARERGDNTASGAADGDVKVDVIEEFETELVVTGSGASAVGAAVYISDGNTFTMTATLNVLIGVLKKQKAASSTTWVVSCQAAGIA